MWSLVMSDLRRLAQPLLDHPLLERTPIEVLRTRAYRRRRRRRLAWFSASLAVAVFLVVSVAVRQSGRSGTVTAGPPPTAAPTPTAITGTDGRITVVDLITGISRAATLPH